MRGAEIQSIMGKLAFRRAGILFHCVKEGKQSIAQIQVIEFLILKIKFLGSVLFLFQKTFYLFT